MISQRKRTTAAVAVALVLAGCSGSDRPTGAAPAADRSTPSTAAPATGKIDGKFDVGGHQLHLRCEGTSGALGPPIASAAWLSAAVAAAWKHLRGSHNTNPYREPSVRQRP